VQDYLIDLAERTRNHPRISLGLSPRGLLIWQRVAQAWALLQHRTFVTPDDVQAVAQPVLLVRLIIDSDPPAVLQEIISTVPVPIHSS